MWDEVGAHRTGSEADAATVAWLADRCSSLGADVELQRVDLEILDPTAATIDIGAGRIVGLPLFDAGRGLRLRGALGPVGSAAPIGLVVAAPDGRSTARLRELRIETDHRALVIVTTGGEPGLCPVNAVDYPRRIGPPALQVSSEHRAALEEAAATGREVLFEVDLAPRAASTVNLVAAVGRPRSGTSAGLTVLTPRTSWWRSTSERGGGIVCWLEILRFAARVPGVGPIRLIATAGHELGHLGLKALLARTPLEVLPGPWLHLGANIGAVGGRITLRSPDPELMRRFEAALDGQEDVVPEVSDREPTSEAQLLHRGGAPYLSVVGTSRWFHNEADRLSDAVDVDRLAAVASGIADAAIAVVGSARA